MENFTKLLNIKAHFAALSNAIEENTIIINPGYISCIKGMKIEVVGIHVPVGTTCFIHLSEHEIIPAEVVGFSEHVHYLMAAEETHGLKHGMKVIPTLNPMAIPMSEHLLGRVLDGMGLPLDGKGKLIGNKYYPLNSKPINPFIRKAVRESLDVGVRAINTLLTVGIGQRLGIFAGSGVGKSVLLGMMTRFTKADVVVVGLIGERGREVKEFIEDIIGMQGMHKTIVVAAPADTSPLMKINGANLATAIAEYFRDQGKNVLLIIDSLTRYAQAQRQISLAVGELPATKGYAPSVFAKISQLVERSGNGAYAQGSITAFYTVLIEGDDHNDPIGDHARSILDGHIVLSRELADAGHYPAIDIEKSISRVMQNIIHKDHSDMGMRFKSLYSCYKSNKEFIQAGMYQPGSDKNIDDAIKYKDMLLSFLKQNINEQAGLADSLHRMHEIFQQ